MSLLVTFNSQNYIIPETNEVGWGSNLDAYLVAIAAGCLQKSGGSFTLSAETDFGASFGLKSLYYKSRTANIASAGQIRLAHADTIDFRNNANSGDLPLSINSSDNLLYNGNVVLTGSSGGFVSSITGTANQVIASASTGAVTLSLPQSIHTAATPTFASETLTATSNQLILGTTRTVTLTAPTPATSSRTITIPDAGADANVVLTESTQTINGAKTFSSVITSTAAQVISASISSASVAQINVQNTGSGGTQILLGHGAVDSSDTWITMFVGTGPTYWSMGPDQSDSSKFKISNSSTLGTNDYFTLNTSGQIANSLTMASSLGILFTDNTTHTVTVKATNSTTSYTLSLPTTAGTNGYGLITDGNGNTSWSATGSGTVASGTAGRLSLYAASTATVSDTYVQNSQNITIAIAAQASRSAALALTIPNPGNAVTAANFVLSEGAQTLNGAMTLSTALAITATSNHLVLSTSTNTLTISAAAQATSARTWTVPDVSGNGTFAALEGTQTFTGAKTFSSSSGVSISGGDLSVSRSLVGDVQATVQNTNNASDNARAMLVLNNGGTSGGDTLIDFSAHTADATSGHFTMGVDQSDSHKFKVNNGTTLGAGASIIITPASSGAAPVAIAGTNTNDSASAGYVGEYVESVVALTSFGSTGVYGDLTSISLTAGDWQVSLQALANANGGTSVIVSYGISTTTGNSTTGLVEGSNWIENSAGPVAGVSQTNHSIAGYRLLLSGSATVYFKYAASFSTATPKAAGRISARRMR